MPSLSTNQRSVIFPFIDKQGNLDKKNASYHTWWHVRTTWKLISLKSRLKFKKTDAQNNLLLAVKQHGKGMIFRNIFCFLTILTRLRSYTLIVCFNIGKHVSNFFVYLLYLLVDKSNLIVRNHIMPTFLLKSKFNNISGPCCHLIAKFALLWFDSRS